MYCPVCRSEYPADWKRCPRDEAALLRDSKVGKYRVDEVIGVGGMGAVYRAFNPDTQSAVAIKLMHAQASANDAARARFQREAAAVAALRTRHVVTIYDFGAETDGTLYLVMELLVGHTLRSEIQRPPQLIPEARLSMIMEGALRGLGAAHRAGITHRDLKPENIFVATTDDGEVTKVLDFGIARVSTKDQALTQSGALMGTPAYMAPEQVAGNRGAIGPWTDVYSMGVILYEGLTGVSPFHADTVTEVLGRVLGRQFIPIAQLRPDLPLPMRAVVERAMADPPDQRFANADVMRNAWVEAHGGTPAVRTEPRGNPRAIAPGVGVLTTARGDSTAPTMTPTPGGELGGPTHRDLTVPGGRRSKAGLWIALGLVAAAGATAAIVLAAGGSKKSGGAPGGTTIDAAVVAPTHTADAAQVAMADAAPPPDAAQLASTDAKPTVPADVDMARFAGGELQMGVDPRKVGGAPDADPPHSVHVKPFELDKHEVTLAQLRAALNDDAAGGLAGDDGTWPARYVTATMAEQACKAMGKRLPSEAEWELAARDAPGDPRGARLLAAPGSSRDAPDPVGTHPGDCTKDGVCDLLGNVMEWTSDPWTRPHARAHQRVVRGGSFRVSQTDPFYATIHARVAAPPDKPDPELGFRCAKDDPGGT